ncbi:MAG TPA: TMEM175 family protein [Acidimicrobiales bacterium]|nr:TMEM175 family protein [Acidimicrobiales bacterium]
MDKGRLEAFSDGVFAVAITILALNLSVAGPGHGPLLHQLAHHWPQFAAYVVSFFTIGIIWVNHHALFMRIALVDRRLLFLNLFLLMVVVLLPFATSTLATYLTTGGRDSHVAAAFYSLVDLAMALAFSAIFRWTLGEGRLVRAVPPELTTRATIRFTIGTLAYVVAFGVSFVSAPAALAITGVVAVYYMFEQAPPLPAAFEDGGALAAGSEATGPE